MTPQTNPPPPIIPTNTVTGISLFIEDRPLILGMTITAIQTASAPRALEVTSPRPPASPQTGTDDFGPSARYTFILGHGKARQIALLHLKSYEKSAALVAHLHYRGTKPLHPDCGLKLEISQAPHFRRGCGSALRSPYWTTPFFNSSFHSLPNQTQFYLWQETRSRYVCMIPLCGGGMKAWLKGEHTKLCLCSASYDRNFVPREIPLFALAYGSDPYKTIASAYRAAIAAMRRPGRLRTEKPYPEVFEYIGWCSWNAFYQGVDANKLIRAANSFKKNGFPVKFILIDDGYFATKNRRLVSFDAPRWKCPRGLRNLTADLKRNYAIRWLGIWHTLQGYWLGIEPRSPLGRKYAHHLLKGKNGVAIPHPRPQKGLKFWSDWHAHLRRQGIDFLKVDNQSTMRDITRDLIPIAEAMSLQQHSLQSSVNAHFHGWMINCMAMSSECCYNWTSSNVSRSSDDFWPDRPDDPKLHAYHNCYNSLWFSQLTFPDFDMFQSHHPHAQFHALLRAVSGGPIYFTDTPGKENWTILRKLVFSDGRILRPDLPCLPTRDILFVDPLKESVPLKAFTKAGHAGILAAFNVNLNGDKVLGRLSPTDVEALPGNTFAIYDHFRKNLRLLRKNATLSLSLDEFQCALYIISPIKNRFAPFGLIDKYISPKAILSFQQEKKVVRLELVEGGRFASYSAQKPAFVSVDGKALPERKWKFEHRLLRISVPMKRRASKNVRLEIRFP